PSGRAPSTLTASASMYSESEVAIRADLVTGLRRIPTRSQGGFTFTLSGGPNTASATGSISTSGGTGTFTFSNLAPSPTASYTVSEAARSDDNTTEPTTPAHIVSAGAPSSSSFSNVALGSVVVPKNNVG